VWQFLLAWSVVIGAVVVFCFARLLLAVYRVRRQVRGAPFMTQDGGRSSPYLPPVQAHPALSTTFLQPPAEPEPEPRPSMASDRSLPYAFLSIDPSRWNMQHYPQSITPRSVSFDGPSSARPMMSPAPTVLAFNTADGLPRPRYSHSGVAWAYLTATQHELVPFDLGGRRRQSYRCRPPRHCWPQSKGSSQGLGSHGRSHRRLRPLARAADPSLNPD
jgi:hypothetical protein